MAIGIGSPLPQAAEHRVGVAGVSELMLQELPAGEYPYLHEVIADHVLTVGFDYDTEFEFGLDLILDGLERLRESD